MYRFMNKIDDDDHAQRVAFLLACVCVCMYVCVLHCMPFVWLTGLDSQALEGGDS